jgi:hypothetical protein
MIFLFCCEKPTFQQTIWIAITYENGDLDTLNYHAFSHSEDDLPVTIEGEGNCLIITGEKLVCGVRSFFVFRRCISLIE